MPNGSLFQTSATPEATTASRETTNSTDGNAASTEQQSPGTKPDVTVKDGGDADTSLQNGTSADTNGTNTETDSPTNSTRLDKGNGTEWDGDKGAGTGTLSTPLGENSTEAAETTNFIEVTTDVSS